MATIELSDDELKTLKDVLNMGRALISSVSGSQITGMAARLGEIVPALETISSPRFMQSLSNAGDDIADIIDLIVVYHKSGILKKALDLITFLSVVRDALSDRAVADMAESVNEILLKNHALLSELQAMGGVGHLLAAAREASVRTDQDQRTLGSVGLLRSLKEPEVQKSIKFIVNFLRIMGKTS